MRKTRMLKILSAMLCALTVFSCLAVMTSAEAITYRKGANDVSSAYKNSKYYNNLMQIQLTGDNITDLLAVALSQVEYVEGTDQSGFSGTQGGGGNYTEYNWSMGNWGQGYGGSSNPWCANFVSWCLLQSRCTNQNSISDWCRNHMGDKNYIWRETGCPRWYENLKNCGYGYDASSSYTPKTGDLIFFKDSEGRTSHIGLVRYYKDGTIYTIEGKTSNAAGVNPEGGGVYCKSYPRNYSSLRGFGSLPYKSNDNVKKVDYSGENPTTGLWISSTNKYLYPDTKLSNSSNYTTIPKGTIFEVTKILSKDCFEAKYNGKTGYVSVNSASPIYQVTSNAAATSVPDKIETEAKVVPNKYAINDDIKKVKEHIGSGISKFTIDDEKIKEVEVFELTAGQKLGIEGFAGFSSYIKEFGYYFDGDAENTVWGVVPAEPTADAKKKADTKAKMFDIDADTSTLANGAHTVTYVVKFLNNSTCDLVTFNLNVSGSSVVGSESSSDMGEGGDGCGSAITTVVVLPLIAFGGAILIKKKRED